MSDTPAIKTGLCGKCAVCHDQVKPTETALDLPLGHVHFKCAITAVEDRVIDYEWRADNGPDNDD